MAKPKFDYNGDAFYDEIEQLAKQGQKDSEIAYALGLKFGVDLNPQVFNRMKNGKYENDSLHRKRQAGHGRRGRDHLLRRQRLSSSADLLPQCCGLKDLKCTRHVCVLQILPWAKISRRICYIVYGPVLVKIEAKRNNFRHGGSSGIYGAAYSWNDRRG